MAQTRTDTVAEFGHNTKRLREIEVLLQLALDPVNQGGPGREDGSVSPAVDPDAPTVHPDAPLSEGEALRADLASPLSANGASPFSLSAILDVPASRLGFLDARSLRTLFLSPETPVPGLALLKDLGKGLLIPFFSARLKLLGRAIYFLSAASARVHHGEAISSLCAGDFRDGVRALEKSGGLEPELLDLCKKAEENMNQVGEVSWPHRRNS
jgi:hypothetical protein